MKETLSAGLQYLHDNKVSIFIDAKKGSAFPYVFNSAKETGGDHSVHGIKLKEDSLGITARLFYSDYSRTLFFKDVTESDKSMEAVEGLLESSTSTVFIPWTTIVAVEL
jgi:hypothetical protein